MDPLTAVNLGIALANAGIKIWGDIKAAKSTPQADGTQTVELIISVRQDKLAQYLTQQTTDLIELQNEITRRTQLGKQNG